ncbi:glycosyltransferase family 2 protein [Blastococcus capsensis]|uniref:glycosyltransferase family 2 protein n=1 Tax=Blastococcus capsensis TaxID=1564163 RepID=UPI002542656C|nr:glycosyltransferase [Blastococcus capsensis]MDK3256144.1 glycosyltransferase [Blastococcus capsensis]
MTKACASGSGDPPLFTVLVPVYRTQPEHLRAMVESVLVQTEPSWELVLVDDGSGDAELTAALAEHAARDARVRTEVLATNSGIVAASARGLAVARGTFVALLDHDDLLVPDALEVVGRAAAAHPVADVFYSDEDQLHDDGHLHNVFRKPDFSPERLRGQMYLGHLVTYRRSLLTEVGGFRDGFDGSQDYDLALRATERAREVVHIPEVLYHWRIHERSVSQRSDNSAVFAAARRALTEHLARVGIEGTVEQVHPVGVYRIRRVLRKAPFVSIIVPTRGSRSVVQGRERCLVVEAVRSVVDRSTYPHYEIVVVADTVTPAEVRRQLVDLAPTRVRMVEYRGVFDYSAKINVGVHHARGDLLLSLNDDTEVLTPDWLETMVGLLAADVGLVGAKLLYEDGAMQHVGMRFGRGHVVHVGEGEPADAPGPVGDYLVDREVSGVTGACALFPRAVFDAVGGLSRMLPVNFNDVDFSIKIAQQGYRVLVTPHAVLHHFESRSRTREVTSGEVLSLRARWAAELSRDRFWRHDTPGLPAEG